MLFEHEGTTFSEFVLVERLAAVHRMLRDPACGHLRIADIALGVGYFGKTPSDTRSPRISRSS